jgi:hypothetical protein
MMKLTSINRCRLVLFLVLAFGSSFTVKGQTASPPQDTRRKIVSDDFVKSRKEAAAPARKRRDAAKRRRTYRLVVGPTARMRPSAAATIRQLGITIWRLRPSRSGDSDRRALIREKNSGAVLVAERVESEGIFREGDYVRLSVESPHAGYIYVVDRDLFADGATGEPMLIFPWSRADNKLIPGRLIDVPGQEDDPNHFTARLSASNQVGELLTFIVTATPLDLPVADNPLRIAPKQLADWERLWGAPVERYEMERGAGELWTQEEQQAAAKKGNRQLTRDDPAPQTIYRVFTANIKGLLVNLRLKYEK